MRAIRLHEPGGQVSLEEVADPVPGPGEALIEVHAAALTAGERQWPRHWPATLSHEVAGVITGLCPASPDQASPDQASLKEGQAVFGLVNFDLDGAAADYVVAPVHDLALKPGDLSYPDAASLTLAALTAWQALTDHGHLRAGQHVLVNGAAGGVGSYTVQLASALGARVTDVAAAGDAEFVAGLGAEQVIDYAAGDRPSRLSITSTPGARSSSRSARTPGPARASGLPEPGQGQSR